MTAGATRPFEDDCEATRAVCERAIRLTDHGVCRLDDEGRVRAADDDALALLGATRDAVLGRHARDCVAEEDAATVTDALGAVGEDRGADAVTCEVTTTGGPDGGVPCELRLGTLRREGAVAGVVCLLRDLRERRRRERALERQRDRLARVGRLDRVLRDVDRALDRARTRGEVESAACAGLTGPDGFRHAWICAPDRARGTVEVRTREAVPDRLVATDADLDGDGAALADRATRTGRVRAGPPADCEVVAAEADSASDVAAVACVPLRCDGRDYGVLVVHATEASAFGGRERSVLGAVGTRVAGAVHAAELRRALLSESVVELTVETDCEDLFPVALSAAAGATVEWDGAVATDDGTLRYYLTVDGRGPSVATGLASDGERVRSVDVVSETDESYRLAVTAEESAPFAALGSLGARLTDLAATDGCAVGRIELPQGEDVRAVVESLETALGDVRVTAQREIHRPPRTRRQFRAAVAEALTDRQRTVLETAYYSGLYEWPRGATGEEVAERLGIAPATFQYHRRAAENAVVGAALGEDD